jgi:hypothetical protein
VGRRLFGKRRAAPFLPRSANLKFARRIVDGKCSPGTNSPIVSSHLTANLNVVVMLPVFHQQGHKIRALPVVRNTIPSGVAFDFVFMRHGLSICLICVPIGFRLISLLVRGQARRRPPCRAGDRCSFSGRRGNPRGEGGYDQPAACRHSLRSQSLLATNRQLIRRRSKQHCEAFDGLLPAKHRLLLTKSLRWSPRLRPT